MARNQNSKFENCKIDYVKIMKDELYEIFILDKFAEILIFLNSKYKFEFCKLFRIFSELKIGELFFEL